MKKHGIAYLAISLGASLSSWNASAATGPVQTPLRVVQMYTANGGGPLFVAFQTGAMPGCYGNAGGYLYPSNGAYKELYSQLLTMMAAGGIRASVVYTVQSSSGNWGDCTIDGIYIQ